MPADAKIGILPKIESADSVGHLSDILDAADGAMVARGDLGAELPVQEVIQPPRLPHWALTSICRPFDQSINQLRRITVIQSCLACCFAHFFGKLAGFSLFQSWGR